MDLLCACGCGEPIEAKPHHKYKGTPRFRPGHQARTAEMRAVMARRRTLNIPPPNPSGLCMCGCGELTPRATYRAARADVVKGEYLRYIRGHNTRGKTGADAHRWTGGRIVNGGGYILAYVPDDPRADQKGYALEHRLVAEEMLGRPLLRGEVVHHIDGNRQNNDPANLQVMTKSEHSKLHAPDVLPRALAARWG